MHLHHNPFTQPGDDKAKNKIKISQTMNEAIVHCKTGYDFFKNKNATRFSKESRNWINKSIEHGEIDLMRSTFQSVVDDKAH